MVSTTVNALTQPDYTLLKEPDTDKPEFLVIKIQVPKCESLNQIGATLDIEEKRVLFFVPDIYELILHLPISIDTLKGGAQLDCQARILTVTLHTL